MLDFFKNIFFSQIDGNFTLDENIADNSGLRAAMYVSIAQRVLGFARITIILPAASILHFIGVLQI